MRKRACSPGVSRAPNERVQVTQTERPVSDEGFDDAVLSFAAERLDLRGRLARLGPSIDAILARHAYPAPVARLLAEAAALTVLLGAALKVEGRFQLQTRSSGVVDLMVVDYEAPDRLRAFARFDGERLGAAVTAGRDATTDLLGRGHLAFTIDPGGDMQRYQGVVPLEGESLEEAAQAYFRQSEQIPTFVRLAVGEEMTGRQTHWRAGALMAQYLPQSEDRQRALRERAPEAAGDGGAGDDIGDLWNEGRALAATVEAHELLDPTLSGERLLYRLFHESGLRVFDTRRVRESCRCSTESIRAMLKRFSPAERADMVGDDGRIGVTCEFCSTKRTFDPAEFD